MPPHAECFRRKYEARDAVIDEVAWLVQECFRGFIRENMEHEMWWKKTMRSHNRKHSA